MRGVSPRKVSLLAHYGFIHIKALIMSLQSTKKTTRTT
jgi:hypothetical protein